MLLAASVVVDAARLWMTHLDCLSAKRGNAAEDMVVERAEVFGVYNGCG